MALPPPPMWAPERLAPLTSPDEGSTIAPGVLELAAVVGHAGEIALAAGLIGVQRRLRGDRVGLVRGPPLRDAGSMFGAGSPGPTSTAPHDETHLGIPSSGNPGPWKTSAAP